MLSCTRCGEVNPDRARFCLTCGAALEQHASRETRKTVTLLFSDVVGSTALGDRLDPESIRRVMIRYFEVMQEVLERHGGTVEKFVGDAIMAVFGIPNVHEDDAERALRAACEMRERLHELNEELESGWGVRLVTRMGVSTGEVVAGDPSRGQAFVSGDTVNVAARLEQTAQPDEILIGKRTWRLCAAAIEAEPVTALMLKGKPEPVPAWRLLSMSHENAGLRRMGNAPFVGRDDEVDTLKSALERVIRERRCVLATIVGPPGIGKSRLAEELARSAGPRARVVTGRCLPYGEGITYWPLAEIVSDVAGSDLRATVAKLVPEQASLVSERLAAAIGRGGSAGSPADICWAFRKLFESLAQERPLVVVIDDIHWAEPTLLDLLEYVAGFASGSPIFVMCLARAELYDARPSWAVPRPNSVVISLQPISDSDAKALIEELPVQHLTPEARDRVARAAEGNPLFIEQLLAFNADSPGNGSILIPPTIQALLATRVDRLGATDRAVVERAAIEGRSFHRGAVAELLAEDARNTVGACLLSLARKELIQPGDTLFPGDEGFRFSHILIRDAAYDAIPKQLRAELHERFATWLEHSAGSRASEYEEILGYHLEQAARYLDELGRSSESQRLAESAGRRLAGAGLRALARGDLPAAINLLTRASDLLPPDDSLRLMLLSELGMALTEAGDMEGAEKILRDAEERARATGNDVAMWRAWVASLGVRAWTKAGAREIVSLATSAREALFRLGDELGLARICHLLGLYQSWSGQSMESDRSFEEALSHAKNANALREESVIQQWMIINSWYGPIVGSEGLRRCREVLAQPHARLVDATAAIELGCFLAMIGNFDEARASYARGHAALDELGQQLSAAGTSQEYFDIAMLAEDPAAAEDCLREACATLETMGDKGFLGTRLGCLAEAVYAQSRFEEAEQISEQAEIAASYDPDDLDAGFRWRAVRGKVLAQRGESVAAENLIREALGLVAGTDWLNMRAQLHLDLAEILELDDRPSEATVAVQEALRLFEEKENLVAASRTRTRLAGLSRRQP
jgi:class 3 adenylate cyclase/tetratricopeptide (TPR) repeat protein